MVVYDREHDTAEPEAEAAPSGQLVAVYLYVDEMMVIYDERPAGYSENHLIEVKRLETDQAAEDNSDPDEPEEPDADPEQKDEEQDDEDEEEEPTARERRIQRLEDGIEDGEPYTSDELAAIAYDKDAADVKPNERAYVSGLRSNGHIELDSMDDPTRNGTAKLYYRGEQLDGLIWELDGEIYRVPASMER